MTKNKESHPFGHWVRSKIAKKHGLSQNLLAGEAGLDAGVISKMCRGHSALFNGRLARDRVLRVIDGLHKFDVIHSESEANEGLACAQMGGLGTGSSELELDLLKSLQKADLSEDCLDEFTKIAPEKIYKDLIAHYDAVRALGRKRNTLLFVLLSAILVVLIMNSFLYILAMGS